MRCSKCGAENPTGLKFCNECATPFGKRCEKCGFENVPTAKFCGECAAPLGGSSTAATATRPNESTIGVTDAPSAQNLDGERKTVTALFADIKGSTELEQDLDPEEARALVDPALKLMIDAVHCYEGYVVQSTGDGIFALFGAPVANEDHPQRALYAALRMQEDLRRYSAKLVAVGGNPVQCRVGANTGEVVVRSIATGGAKPEYTPIGHTTNLASRMEAVAPIGSIAITELTRKLCEGYFTLKPLGPTKLRGVSELVKVYEVIGLGPIRTRLQRAAGRGYSKFVGREREMEAMRAAAQLARTGHGQIVAAIAEAGAGKSRLFFEFKTMHKNDWRVLEAFSFSHGNASPYFPVIELLHGYFGIEASDDARTRREKIVGENLGHDRTQEDGLPYLFGLLGIVEGDDPLAAMDGQLRKRRTLDAIKRILLRESLDRPLMVIFEDLHWIDEETQAFLNLFADSIATARILLLVNYRPDYSHPWSSKSYYTQLRLDPLARESADEMLTAILGDGAPLDALKALIRERTEGNPFFMEETVQVLLDEGALVRDTAGFRLTKQVSDLKIPATVQAILAARIDRLPADHKELLQALAVIGREFSLTLIRAVVSKSGEELARIIDDLQMGEFIYEQPAVGDREYIFKHALTQEVAYSSLLIERRRNLHERTARAIEELAADHLDDCYDELAHHYRISQNGPKAIEYLRLAGEQAAGRGAIEKSTEYLRAALKLVRSQPEDLSRAEQELAIQISLGRSLMFTSGLASAETGRAWERAQELCSRLGESPQLIPALSGLFIYHNYGGRLAAAHQVAMQLLSLAELTRDKGALLIAHYALSSWGTFLGDFETGRQEGILAWEVFDQKLALPTFLDGLRVASTGLVGMSLTLLGYPQQGLDWGIRALNAAHLKLSIAQAEITRCFVFGFLGDGVKMTQSANQIISIAQEHGQSLGAIASIFQGCGLSLQGRFEEGIPVLCQGIAAYISAGTKGSLPAAYDFLALSCLKAGRFEQGLEAASQGINLLEETGQRNVEADLYINRANLILAKDPLKRFDAEPWLRKAVAIARIQKSKWFELRAAIGLARLLSETDRRDEAHAMLTDIYNWFTEGFDTADLKDAKALLDELSDREA